MARKIALVQTFQHNPRLVIMDEPTEGLDPLMQDTFYQLLKEYRDNGGTVFISSHHLREVEQVCDRAAIIRKGRLAAVEKIRDLVKHAVRLIHVSFKQPITPAQLDSDAWEIISKAADGKKITARLTGELDTIIKLLSRFEIRDLELPRSSLQDVFLEYYRGDDNEQ